MTRQKQITYKSAKNKLDKWFSLFIRLRDSDENGMCKCVTCGSPFFYKDGDCGHCLSRRYLSTRWDEKNCMAQDKKCNIFNQGEQLKFSREIDKRWGVGTIEMLEMKKNNKWKASAFELNILAEEYKGKVNEMLTNKNL